MVIRSPETADMTSDTSAARISTVASCLAEIGREKAWALRPRIAMKAVGSCMVTV